MIARVIRPPISLQRIPSICLQNFSMARQVDEDGGEDGPHCAAQNSPRLPMNAPGAVNVNTRDCSPIAPRWPFLPRFRPDGLGRSI